MDVCTHIVSDRLYLIDNLLCLLSNAVKYSDRGATIDVFIEVTTEETIMNPTVTPVINAIHVAGAVDSTIQSYVAVVANSGLSKPGSLRGVLEASPTNPKGRKGSSCLSKPGSLRGVLESSPTSPKGRKGSSGLSKPGSVNGSCEIFSKTKECSMEIKALFGISGTPNHPNPDRLKKEMTARLLLDEPLAEMMRPAMLVVRVVDSGISLSGIT